ncbi:hypothetical protein TELCIR_22320, partial [Teladorsagia circumcincta]
MNVSPSNLVQCLWEIAKYPVGVLFQDLSDSEWLQKIRPIWELVESLVDKDLVHSVGVSDLDVDRLRLLCEEAKEHKPTINHYSIDGCCTVPAELVEYAKAHDIQLLTHNDPRSCDLDTDV